MTEKPKTCRSRLLTFDQALAYVRMRGVNVTEEEFLRAVECGELEGIEVVEEED